MLRLTRSVCIDADAASVWAVLSDLESIPLWVPSIRRAHCPAQARGVGAMRVCELPRATIRETIVDWDEGRSFTYRGEGAPLMKSATNTWTVEARGAETLVTSSAAVVVKGGVLGRLLEPALRPMFERLGTRSLASLKYLVERGHPYRGVARELPPPPASC